MIHGNQAEFEDIAFVANLDRAIELQADGTRFAPNIFSSFSDLEQENDPNSSLPKSKDNLGICNATGGGSTFIPY